ncbi:MAG: MATE family efflux transporter, partial [Clostridiales bacterium]|nr:MATE family efflux transporter [Clostridiales bacterium]MDY4111173.1 MATE family efflux transporter [Roseburia sp.]
IGETVVTAYGLYYKIQQFILFAAFGLRDAITPIISFNYGMQSKLRVKEGIRYGMGYTLIVMFAGLVLLEVFAQPFATIFGLSGETQSLCVQAMRIVSLSFLFAGANIAYQGIFQALNAGVESLIISVCRQFLFVLPVAWGFSILAKQDAGYMWLVWSTFLIAELLTVIIAALFMKKINRHTVCQLQDK